MWPASHPASTLVETVEECWAQAKPTVLNPTVCVAAIWVVGLAAELVAHEDVPDSAPFELGSQRLARKLRLEARIRCRSHVDEVLGPGLLENRDEIPQASSPVPHRENFAAGVHRPTLQMAQDDFT